MSLFWPLSHDLDNNSIFCFGKQLLRPIDRLKTSMENSVVGSSSGLSNKNHANSRCHRSPASPSNGTAHRGRTSDSGDSFGDKINENNQETVNHHFTKPMGSNYHVSAKSFKHFTGPSVSVASTSKKKILGENGEILNSSKSNAEDEIMYSSLVMAGEESPNESAKAGPQQSIPASSFNVQGTPDSYGLHDSKDFERITPSLPYDPVNNYLTPRPQYLRYRPNRRLEWTLSNKRRLDAEEQPVSGESNMDQIEKDRNFSEDENLCILSSGDDSSENHEEYLGYNQQNGDTNLAKETGESPQDEENDDDHCEEVQCSSSGLLRLAIIFVLMLGGFSLYFTHWPVASSSHTFPDKMTFQAKYVARSLKAIPNSFRSKCLKVIESRNREYQNGTPQVLAGYLCAVLYPHSAGYETQSAQMSLAHAVETMGSRENSSHVSSLEDEVPLSMHNQSTSKHIRDEESDGSSRMAVEREPVNQKASLLLGIVEDAGEFNELQETRVFNNGTGEAEHGLPKSSEPLQVLKEDDIEDEEIEYELPISYEAFDAPKDGDGEVTDEIEHVVMEEEMDQQISEEEEYEYSNNEDQLDIDTDKQLSDDENEIRDQRSWLLKNKAKNSFVVGMFALTAVISTTFCIFYRRKHSRVGGDGDVGPQFLSCEKENTAKGSAHLPDERIAGAIPPRAVGESRVPQTGHHLATSSVCCSEVGGANLAASTKENRDATSSLYSSKGAEAELEVSSGRRYRKKKTNTYSNHEAASPPSENSIAASLSYGSFYSQEKFKGNGDEEIVTPVRRSSRLRKQVHSPR